MWWRWSSRATRNQRRFLVILQRVSTETGQHVQHAHAHASSCCQTGKSCWEALWRQEWIEVYFGFGQQFVLKSQFTLKSWNSMSFNLHVYSFIESSFSEMKWNQICHCSLFLWQFIVSTDRAFVYREWRIWGIDFLLGVGLKLYKLSYIEFLIIIIKRKQSKTISSRATTI